MAALKHPRVTTATLKKKFLEEYAEIGTITHAAKKVGRDRDTILRWRKQDKVFDEAVLASFSDNTENLEKSAYERALAGSDTLTIFLLKSRRPERYRERYEVVTHGTVATRLDLGGITTEKLEQLSAALDVLDVGK